MSRDDPDPASPARGGEDVITPPGQPLSPTPDRLVALGDLTCRLADVEAVRRGERPAGGFYKLADLAATTAVGGGLALLCLRYLPRWSYPADPSRWYGEGTVMLGTFAAAVAAFVTCYRTAYRRTDHFAVFLLRGGRRQRVWYASREAREAFLQSIGY